MPTQIGTLFPGKNTVDPDYVNIVRTDASFATRHLQECLINFLPGDQDVNQTSVKEVVNGAYAEWGTSVVHSLKHCSGGDNDNYVLDDGQSGSEYHLHDAQKLASLVIENAGQFNGGGAVTPLLVSLDDIITSTRPELSDIAFSRLFSMDGRNYYDYVPRPGYVPLAQQFKELCHTIDSKVNELGVSSLPIVLLEDNVRHARMLTWLFKQMQDHGALDKAEITGISSCFCCASEEEQKKIVSKGKVVPVTSVVEYHGAKIDVITPRDLLFDGFVVDIDGKNCRLPGIFMDVKSRFNIEASHESRFLDEVIDANMIFCEKVESYFGVKIPLSWLATSKAISHVTLTNADTPVIDLMKQMKSEVPHRRLAIA